MEELIKENKLLKEENEKLRKLAYKYSCEHFIDMSLEDMKIVYEMNDKKIIEKDIYKLIKYFSENKKFEEFKLLFEYFDINLEISGYRPIHIICQYGTIEMLKYLVEKGADIESQTETNKCFYSDKKYRPIHMICKHGTFEMLEYIVNKGVDINAEATHGWQPLHNALQFMDLKSIIFLIEKNVNLNIRTYEYTIKINYIKGLLKYNNKISNEEKEKILNIINEKTRNTWTEWFNKIIGIKDKKIE